MIKKLVIFQNNKKPNIFQKDFKSKLIFKYLIVFYTIFLCFYLLLTEVSKNNLKEYERMVWIGISLITINFVSILMIAFNETWNKSKYLTLFWISIFFTYESLLVFLLNKMVPNEWIKFYDGIYFILIPILGGFSLWNLSIGYLERKIQPFFYKKNILSFINYSLIIGGLIILDFILKTHTSLGENKNININSYAHMSYLVSLIIIFLTAFLQRLYIKLKFTKAKLNFKKDYSRYYLSSAIWITPFTIWFSKDYQFDDFDKFNLFFIILPIIVIVICTFFSLFKNTELSSFKIFKIIIVISFLFLWVNKLFFEYYYKLYLDFNWTVLVTIVSTNVLCLLLITKKSNDSLNEALSISSFIFLCSMIIIVSWVLKQYNVSQKLLNGLFNWTEIINMSLISSAVILLIKTIISWFKTTLLINSFDKNEKKLSKKSNLTKIKNLSQNNKIKEKHV